MLEPSSTGPSLYSAVGGDPVVDDCSDELQLDPIVVEAMENERDRVMILQFETQIETFVKDKTRSRLSFPPMSSYHRLILHRIAQFYRVDHPSQLLPDGKRQILLVKQVNSRIPRVRICEMECSTSISTSASTSIQSRAPPMRIMRRSQADMKQNNPNDGLTPSETDQTLQSREEAYAKARAKLFDIEDAQSDPVVYDDLQYNEPRIWDIEPHEQDLYRRNVGMYNSNRMPPPVPSIYYPGQVAPPLIQPFSAYMSPPMQQTPPNFMSGGPYWPPMNVVVPNDSRGVASGYDPTRPSIPVRTNNFSSPVQSMFVNESKIADDSWSLEAPQNPSSDYSFCTSMLEIYDLPEGAKNYQIDMLLDSLKQRNCILKWIADGRIIAVFETASAALSALQQVQDSSYKLRPWSGAL